MGIIRDKILPPFVNDLFSKKVNKSEYYAGEIMFGNNFIPPDLIKFLRSAEWVDVSNLYNIYRNNPILFAALSINAKYFSSVEVKVRNIKTGEIYSKQNMREGKINDDVAIKMFNIISQPNPLESTVEFLTFNSVSHDLYGNSFIKGNFALDKIDIKNVATLNNLKPNLVKPKLTGKHLYQTQLNQIVEGWEYGNLQKPFSPDEVLHRKEPNLNYSTVQDNILGESRVIPLQKPLSNISLAYEARNVIAKERGISVVISGDNKDYQFGSIPLDPKQQDELQKAFKKKYGTMEGQNQYYFAPFPVKVDQIDQDIRKLGILDEIGMDAMIVAHIYNIPLELIKMFLQGATYENQGASDRRMYQTNAIPRAEDFFEDLNNWLQTRKYGFEYVPSWDHIAVLKADRKEESLVRRNESFVCREAFLAGTITGNEWRMRMGFEKSGDKWFDLYIWQMSDSQVNLITGRNTMMAQNENKPDADSSSQI